MEPFQTGKPGLGTNCTAGFHDNNWSAIHQPGRWQHRPAGGAWVRLSPKFISDVSALGDRAGKEVTGPSAQWIVRTPVTAMVKCSCCPGRTVALGDAGPNLKPHHDPIVPACRRPMAKPTHLPPWPQQRQPRRACGSRGPQGVTCARRTRLSRRGPPVWQRPNDPAAVAGALAWSQSGWSVTPPGRRSAHNSHPSARRLPDRCSGLR